MKKNRIGQMYTIAFKLPECMVSDDLYLGMT